MPSSASPLPSARTQAVLVTGCSSGIGRATAMLFHQAGHPVYATARRPESLTSLAEAGIRTLRLDVTDEASMTAAVKEVTEAHGAVGALVNNAGYALSGPVEEEDLAAVREQFETNLFGLTRLVQLVLPGMREQSHGTIVNVSSSFGRYAVPGGAFYHASKHALEGLSDALRLEVEHFGVRVVLIQPGPVRSEFGERYLAGLAPGEQSVYGSFRRRSTEYYQQVFHSRPNSGIGRFVLEPEEVARTIRRAVRSSRPRARYPLGLLSRSSLLMRRAFPDRLFDAYVRKTFPTPGA